MEHPHLINALAHEWQTLLTVLKLAQGITSKVIGPDNKTVVSLDMGLYKPAKQLQMARNDMNHLIFRPGELHIVMAQLRTIGAYIESSGIDFCWTEADLYASATVRQIINGNHVKRGIEAHTLTLQALFSMYQEAFFEKHPDLLDRLQMEAKELDKACGDGNREKIMETNTHLLQTIESLQITGEFSKFDDENRKSPLFTVMRHYMRMVLEMLLFIRSVRTGDWELHLMALETFTKYFFAHDRLNYARMIQ